ncbi:MAG: hypothetical protein XD63_0190 [Thermoanaerobacterales bacterium 50_218]|nr:MAG: hypothetical protein XD63_0190 [Thermoanaerobacterales bacterium 50_218]HAA89432.1 hypothetical protein [Peptococcaceae bacterium]
MKAGVGYSSHQSPEVAGREAARRALKLSGQPVVTFLFTTGSYDQEKVLEAVLRETGKTRLLGACGAGLITPDGVLEKGVGVLTISGEDIFARTALVKINPDNPVGTGREIAKELLSNSPVEQGTVVLFPDGFGANISKILCSLYGFMGPGYQFLGAGAGDNMQCVRPFQMSECGVASGCVAAALISGCSFGIAIRHGWKRKGPPLVITRAEGKFLYEFDGRPAFEVYSERLGSIEKENFPVYGAENPLGIPETCGYFLVRDPLNVRDDGSIELVTEVPMKAVAYLMCTTLEEQLKIARETVTAALKKVTKPVFALVFNCVSRFLLMGEHYREELEVIKNLFGDQFPFLGFLSFGEIGAYSGVPLLHNKSLLVAVGGG